MLIWCLAFFALGVAGTWLARRYSVRRRLIDDPGERRSHTVATPRGGGISIVAAMLVATGVLASRFPGHFMLLSAFAGGLLVVAGVGWLDDHRPLSPWPRLLAHVLAGFVLGTALILQGSPWWLGLVAAAFVVTLANIWNFMDGINGIAASQAGIVACGFALVLGAPWSSLALAMIAACVGFLPFNFPRARIFLGDVGSGALGFAIAALGSVVLAGRPQWSSLALVLFPLAPFMIDAGLTLIRRIVRRELWWTPHTQHAYQVLARQKGHTFVTLAYGITGLLAVLLMVSAAHAGKFLMVLMVSAWYMSCAFLWLFIQRRHQAGS